MNYKLVVYEVVLRIRSLPENLDALWGALVGALLFLVGVPDAPLYALLVVMSIDLITKIRSLSSANGGYINATRSGVIRSRLIFRGTFDKLISYSMVICLVHMSQYFIPLFAAQLFKSMAYGFLYYVEGHSCLENMQSGAKAGSATSIVTTFLLGQWNDVFAKVIPKIIPKKDENNVV